MNEDKTIRRRSLLNVYEVAKSLLKVMKSIDKCHADPLPAHSRLVLGKEFVARFHEHANISRDLMFDLGGRIDSGAAIACGLDLTH